MTPIAFACDVTLISVVAGIVGSVLGLGGGIIVTPALTLIFGVDIRLAIGASLISVIATSSGSAIAYLRDRIANVRIGMLLEVGTTTGGICGALLGSILSPRWILMSFGIFLLYSALMMLKKILRYKKGIVLAVFLALIAAGGATYYYKNSPPVETDTTAVVGRGDIKATVSATGTCLPERPVRSESCW